MPQTLLTELPARQTGIYDDRIKSLVAILVLLALNRWQTQSPAVPAAPARSSAGLSDKFEVLGPLTRALYCPTFGNST